MKIQQLKEEKWTSVEWKKDVTALEENVTILAQTTIYRLLVILKNPEHQNNKNF